MIIVKIGERDLAITRPANLDEQMTAATGCTAAEQIAILARAPTPFAVARALHPMLGADDGMPITTLADLIVAAGTDDIARQVAGLLVPPAALPNA